MLILPEPAARGRQMLTVMTVTLVIGLALAVLIRLALGMSLGVPFRTAATVAPGLAILWVWHLRRWPGVAWAEATVFTAMVMAAQMVMEVHVSEALFVIPVIGIFHRNQGLALYTAALGMVAYAVLLVLNPHLDGTRSIPLQIGAHLVLQGMMVSIYVFLIRLAERAERSLVQARMTGQMAMQWAASIEARDQYTGGHVERVTQYALQLAPLIPNLGMDLELFRLACILHDVGKLAVPDQILNKPGPLTPDEFRVIQEHSANGYDLVLRTNVPPEVAAVVRSHHERWDGQGYPDGLQGKEIPVAAREQILAGAGTQFDPAVVAAFEKVFAQWAAQARRRACRTATAAE